MLSVFALSVWNITDSITLFKQQQEQQRDIIVIIVINYFTKQHLKTYLFQVPLTLSVGQPSYVP